MEVRALRATGLLLGMSLAAAAVTAPAASAASATALRVLDEIGRPAANVAMTYAPRIKADSGITVVGTYKDITTDGAGEVTLPAALDGSACVINTKPVSLIKVNGRLQADAAFNCTDPRVNVQLVTPSQPTTIKVDTTLNSATAHIYASPTTGARWVQVGSTTVASGRVDFYTIPGVVYTVFITPPAGSDYYPQFLGGLPYEPDTAPGSPGTITSVKADGSLVVSGSLKTTGPVVVKTAGDVHVMSLWGGQEEPVSSASGTITLHGLTPTPYAIWSQNPAFTMSRTPLKVVTPNQGTTPATVSLGSIYQIDFGGCTGDNSCSTMLASPKVAGSVQVGDELTASLTDTGRPPSWAGAEMSTEYYWSASLNPAGGKTPDGVLHPVDTDPSITITPDLLASPIILKLVTVVTPKDPGSRAISVAFANTVFQTPDTYKPGEGYAKDAVFANITPCAAPTVIKSPAISGKLKAGSTVKVSMGTWSKPVQKLTYQWTADGKAITGATSFDLDVAKNLEGKQVEAVVTMTPPGCLPASVTVDAGKVPGSSKAGTKGSKASKSAKHQAKSKIKIKRVIIKHHATVKVKVAVKSKRKPVGKIKVKTGKRKITKKLTRRMHGKATVKIKHLHRGRNHIKAKFKGSKKVRPSKWAKVTVKIK